MHSVTENASDTIKIALSASAPVLTVFGISLDQWTYILSAIVSIFFLIEKSPVVIRRIITFKNWLKRKKREFNESDSS